MAEFWPTQYAGHAIELARSACREEFDVVAAAGGDGTVHEVVNGLLSTGIATPSMAVIPIGSANDFAHSVARQFGASSLNDGRFCAVDVGLVQDSLGRQRFFIESLGLGLSAEVTLQSRRISRLQGKLLYALAVYRALRTCTPAQLNVCLDERDVQSMNVMLLSALVGRREGGFVLAPSAKLDDGQLDVVSAAPMSPLRVLCMLPRIALAGLPTRHPQVSQRQCRTMTVWSLAPLIAHTDGEIHCSAGDNVKSLSVRVLPARLKVKLCLP
jgi:diacylglycerol kinase family enzyme